MLKEKLQRVIRAGLLNFRRNSYVTFGTTGVLSLVLLLLLGMTAVRFVGSTVVGALEEKVDVSVYLTTTAKDEDVRALRADLEGLTGVASVEYVSRDDALAMFKERHANDALIQESLAEINENPLEASLNVRASDTAQYGSIVSFLEAHELRSSISTIDYYENEQVISRVQRISDSAQRGGIVAVVILSIIAILVAFNTIRLTIYNQKQEIEIMRLVGGSNWYIRAPFIVEGSMYGIVAGVLALIVFGIGVHMVSPKLALLLSGVSLQAWFIGELLSIIAITLVVGILLGVVSSVIAIHRFLRI